MEALSIVFKWNDESESKEDGTECTKTYKLPWLPDVVEHFKKLLDTENMWIKTHKP